MLLQSCVSYVFPILDIFFAGVSAVDVITPVEYVDMKSKLSAIR
jgi:hypothetical protein